MLTFKEYYLDAASVSVQTLYLPLGAVIATAYIGYSGITLAVLIDPNESVTVLRKFKVCTNGENIYEDTVKYIDTIIADYGIRHIIELL